MENVTYGQKYLDVNTHISNTKQDPNDYESYEDYENECSFIAQLQNYMFFLKQFPENDLLKEEHEFNAYLNSDASKSILVRHVSITDGNFMKAQHNEILVEITIEGKKSTIRITPEGCEIPKNLDLEKTRNIFNIIASEISRNNLIEMYYQALFKPDSEKIVPAQRKG